MNRKIVFGGAAALLLLAFAVAAYVYSSGKGREAALNAASQQAGLNRAHAPSLGKPEARVHIVEFLDPACETCRAFYPELKRLLKAEPERLRLSLRHVPLHQGSAEVVALLEAAKLQGQYWVVLEALLAAQQQWVVRHVVQPAQAWRVVEGLGLDLKRLEADMQSPAVLKNVEQDRQDAAALKVTKTPEYFVNGRPLPRFGLDQLEQLVAEELRRAY